MTISQPSRRRPMWKKALWRLSPCLWLTRHRVDPWMKRQFKLLTTTSPRLPQLPTTHPSHPSLHSVHHRRDKRAVHTSHTKDIVEIESRSNDFGLYLGKIGFLHPALRVVSLSRKLGVRSLIFQFSKNTLDECFAFLSGWDCEKEIGNAKTTQQQNLNSIELTNDSYKPSPCLLPKLKIRNLSKIVTSPPGLSWSSFRWSRVLLTKSFE